MLQKSFLIFSQNSFNFLFFLQKIPIYHFLISFSLISFKIVVPNTYRSEKNIIHISEYNIYIKYEFYLFHHFLCVPYHFIKYPTKLVFLFGKTLIDLIYILSKSFLEAINSLKINYENCFFWVFHAIDYNKKCTKIGQFNNLIKWNRNMNL